MCAGVLRGLAVTLSFMRVDEIQGIAGNKNGGFEG
jgi:hypothetical protein